MFPASEDRDAVVGKDLYLDSTSKLDLQEDTVPLKGGSGPSATPSPSPSASTSQEEGKQGNGEPRSEESDAGVCVFVCGGLAFPCMLVCVCVSVFVSLYASPCQGYKGENNGLKDSLTFASFQRALQVTVAACTTT